MKSKQEIVKDLRLYLFDMDGTLYLGDRLFDFTVELLAELKKHNCRYMFMTNNSSKSVEDYIKKLARLGIIADRDEFITSSQATVYYLKKHHSGKRLYVCGTQSLIKEFESEGFEVTENIGDTEVIVIGNDTELTFKKLYDISYMLTTRDIPYIATNPDSVCPTEFGFVPDCGSMCDMLYNATGKKPIFIGKPEALMPLLAMEAAGYEKNETAVIGDRIHTDIKSGINAGITSILVLSGEATLETLEKSADKPDIVMSSAKEILDIIK